MTRDEVLNEVRQMAREAGSQKELAAKVGVHPTILSQNMRGNRTLEPAFLLATGFERVVSYRRRGHAAQLETSEGVGA